MLLRGAVADPSARLSALPVLTEAELRRELAEWNDTAAPLPGGCVHEGVRGRRRRGTPDAVAAEFDGQQLVLRASWTGRPAGSPRRLRRLGVGPEALVGVCHADRAPTGWPRCWAS